MNESNNNNTTEKALNTYVLFDYSILKYRLSSSIILAFQ